MVAVFLSIYFIFHCYRRARLNGRNPFVWPVVGAMAFIIVSNLTIYVAAQLLNGAGLEPGSIYFLYGTIPPGLIVGFVITNALTNRFLPPPAGNNQAGSEIGQIVGLPELEEALVAAIFDQDSNQVARLLNEGADIHRKDEDGYSAIDYALLKGGEVKKLVLARKKNK